MKCKIILILLMTLSFSLKGNAQFGEEIKEGISNLCSSPNVNLFLSQEGVGIEKSGLGKKNFRARVGYLGSKTSGMTSMQNINEKGFIRLDTLPPGEYRLQVEVQCLGKDPETSRWKITQVTRIFEVMAKQEIFLGRQYSEGDAISQQIARKPRRTVPDEIGDRSTANGLQNTEPIQQEKTTPVSLIQAKPVPSCMPCVAMYSKGNTLVTNIEVSKANCKGDLWVFVDYKGSLSEYDQSIALDDNQKAIVVITEIPNLDVTGFTVQVNLYDNPDFEGDPMGTNWTSIDNPFTSKDQEFPRSTIGQSVRAEDLPVAYGSQAGNRDVDWEDALGRLRLEEGNQTISLIMPASEARNSSIVVPSNATHQEKPEEYEASARKIQSAPKPIPDLMIHAKEQQKKEVPARLTKQDSMIISVALIQDKDTDEKLLMTSPPIATAEAIWTFSVLSMDHSGHDGVPVMDTFLEIKDAPGNHKNVTPFPGFLQKGESNHLKFMRDHDLLFIQTYTGVDSAYCTAYSVSSDEYQFFMWPVTELYLLYPDKDEEPFLDKYIPSAKKEIAKDEGVVIIPESSPYFGVDPFGDYGNTSIKHELLEKEDEKGENVYQFSHKKDDSYEYLWYYSDGEIIDVTNTSSSLPLSIEEDREGRSVSVLLKKKKGGVKYRFDDIPLK
ncbi:MAG: hypothetical protein ACI83D_000534 [Planctomycetota bacterium]|jgi:hypothetical protein